MAEEEFLEDADIKISNEVARQERINKEMEESNQNYKDGNVERWKVNLDILYREIHPRLEKEERISFKELLNEIRNKYEEYCKQPDNNQLTSDFCEKLNELDIKIKEVVYKNGE